MSFVLSVLGLYTFWVAARAFFVGGFTIIKNILKGKPYKHWMDGFNLLKGKEKNPLSYWFD